MTPTPEEIVKVIQDLCDEHIAALDRWTRPYSDNCKCTDCSAIRNGRALIARLSPPSPEAAGNPNVPEGPDSSPAVAEGVKGETRRVWESPQLGLLYVWDGRFIWAHLKDRQWATVNKRIDDMPDKWELAGPDATNVLADFDMREVSRG